MSLFMSRMVIHGLAALVGLGGLAVALPGGALPAEARGGAATVARDSRTEALTDGNGVPTARAAAGLGASASRGPTPAVLTDEIQADRFAVAALTWPTGSTPPPGMEFRVREERGWSEWLPVEPDAADVPGELRAGTEPFVTGGATAIQVRIDGDPKLLPRDLELVVIPVEDATEATAAGGAASPTAQPLARGAGGLGSTAPVRIAGLDVLPSPDIITREEWGADPALLAWEPIYAPLQAAVLHHTAGTNTYTAAQSKGIVQAIYRYHAVDRGWGDIGYNFLVDKYGQVFEGRQGSVGSPPREMVIGGHARPANTGTLGISAMGDYTVAAVPAAIYDAYARVISWRFDLAGLDARDTSGISSPGSPTLAAGVDLPRIFGHRDVAATACPGDAIHAAMAGLRDRIGAPARTWGATPAVTAVYRWWSPTVRDWRSAADDPAASSDAELAAGGYSPDAAPQFYATMDSDDADRVAVFRWWHEADGDWIDVAAGSISDSALISYGYSAKRFQYYGHSAGGPGRVAVNRWWSAADRDWITLLQDEIPDAALTGWGYTSKTLVAFARTSPQLATPVHRWWGASAGDWLGLAEDSQKVDFGTPDGYVRVAAPQFYVATSPGPGLVAIHRWWHPGDGDWIDIREGTVADSSLSAWGYREKAYQYHVYDAPASGRVAVNRWWSAVDRDWITLRQDEYPDATLVAWGYTGKSTVGYAVASPEP